MSRMLALKLVALFLVAIAPLFSAKANEKVKPDPWFRSLHEGGPAVPFALVYVYHQGGKITLSAWSRYLENREPFTLHGRKEADGAFRPIITYEVAKEAKTKWEKIPSEIKQPSPNTVKIDRDNVLVRLVVDMKPFQKVIGAYRYGRVVLENGDSGVFELKDLLPPVAED